MACFDNSIPSYEFVEDINIFLEIVYFGRFLRLEDGERRHRSAILDILTTWLKEPACEEDLEQGVGIFE